MPEHPEITGANADQIAFWNSSPGGNWVAFQMDLDAIHRSILQHLMERAHPEPRERVLDIGCGAGSSTMEFASRIGPEGEAVGLDISRPLLDRAEELKAKAGLANIQYLLADAQTHTFDSGRFDLLASRFGVMFFSDPVAAFKNLARALRAGGRVALVSWAGLAGNPWFEIPRNIAVARLGRPTPQPLEAPGPFAFSDGEHVLGILRDGGFTDCSAERTEVILDFPGTAEDAAHIASHVGAATRIMKEYGAGPSDLEAIERDVAIEFQTFAAGGALHIPAVVNFFGAIRP